MTVPILALLAASLLGSLHCAGMCGAFVLFAVGGHDAPKGRRAVLLSAYNLGRLTTYVLLGVAAGMVGELVDLGGALVGISRVAVGFAGAVMIGFGVVALLHAMGKRAVRLSPPAFMQRWLGAGQRMAMTFRPVPRAALIGLLTTLLPCGWLYAFAGLAVGTGSPLWGAVTMAVFWVGTLPVLVCLGAGFQTLMGRLGPRLPAATALIVIGVGLWTLIGRAGLDAQVLAQSQSAAAQAGDDPIDRLQQLNDETPACCEGEQTR